MASFNFKSIIKWPLSSCSKIWALLLRKLAEKNTSSQWNNWEFEYRFLCLQNPSLFSLYYTASKHKRFWVFLFPDVIAYKDQACFPTDLRVLIFNFLYPKVCNYLVMKHSKLWFVFWDWTTLLPFSFPNTYGLLWKIKLSFETKKERQSVLNFSLSWGHVFH